VTGTAGELAGRGGVGSAASGRGVGLPLQTRPAGILLTPWGTAYDNGALDRLTVEDVGPRGQHVWLDSPEQPI
jgi:hypothetical protein